mgnify:CR=1 FL=1
MEATLQEEIDCDDMPEPVYDYSDPNHKPPFKYVDYTEIEADNNNEVNFVVDVTCSDRSDEPYIYLSASYFKDDFLFVYSKWAS